MLALSEAQLDWAKPKGKIDMNYPPTIDPQKETGKITKFIRDTLKEAGKTEALIAASGGVDSSTSLMLTARTLKPEHLHVLYLPARSTHPIHLKHLHKVIKLAKVPEANLKIIPVTAIIQKTWRVIKHYTNQGGGEVNKFVQSVRTRPKAWQTPHSQEASQVKSLADKRISVDAVSTAYAKIGTPNRRIINARFAELNRLRLANLAARARMLVIYDQAKLFDALVIGTENHSEHLLGYYTRFGDEASDLEPIKHLYKSQLLQLAKYLKIPKEIIEKPPTAGLWIGQTDETELGFSYEEADPILFLHYEQQLSPIQIAKLLTKDTQKKPKEVKKIVETVLNHCEKLDFKHALPYAL